MEFWGAEVKVGEVVKVAPEVYEAYVHLSQATLGEAKKDKTNEPVVLNLKVGDQKFVLGTLSRDKIPQTTLEVVLDKEFELSHNCKTSSVYFIGYKAHFPDEDGEDTSEEDFTDSDEDLPLMKKENGKSVTKAEDSKVSEPKKSDAKSGASAKQVKVIDPKKDEEDDSDDESDEDVEFGSSDDEMEGADSDDESESDEDDGEETPPKKADLGKKRANDSASKTPVPTKKAKNATPEKTDGKKSGHTDTPHPMKKAGKTPNSETKGQTPKSGGQFNCGSCQKNFNSEGGLQQHNKAKHGQ